MIVARALAFAFAASLCATLSAVPLAAAADDEAQPAETVLSVDDLNDIRGRYVPAPVLPSVEGLGTRSVTDVMRAPLGIVNDPGVSPLASLGSSGGTLQNLDLTMTSTWKTSAGTTYAAGLDLTLNPATSTLTQHTFATVSNGSDTLAALPGSAEILAGVNGVGQSIVLAGTGNQTSNRAAVTVSSGPIASLPFVPPAGAPCVNACQVGIGAQGARVLISIPAGMASQRLGTDGILQTIHAQSDLNTVQNALALHLQFAPGTFNPTAILPVLLQGNLAH